MKNTLESRLAEYEVKRPISCDGELIAALGEIIEKERGRRRCDFDLIDEALTFLLELSGKDTEPSAAASVLRMKSPNRGHTATAQRSNG